MVKKNKYGKVGNGKRFAAGLVALKKKGFSKKSASSILAAQGMKKYGKARFLAMALAGRHRKKK